jgi:hypothetical protein
MLRQQVKLPNGHSRWTSELIDAAMQPGWTRIGEYDRKTRKILLRCPFGHERLVFLKDHLRGFDCAVCSGSAKKTDDQIRAILDSGWTPVKYTNATTPIDLLCPNKHPCRITYVNYLRGDRCSECNGTRRKTVEDIDVFLTSIGYKRDDDFVMVSQKIQVICDKGHRVLLNLSTAMHSGARCRQCYLEKDRKGPKSHFWDHEKSPEDRENNRQIEGINDFKKAVYQRDGYKCVICGTPGNGGNLNAHHLDGYDNHKELRTDPNNGVCVDDRCHHVFHFFFGKGDNTREQFDAFVDMVRLGEYGDLPFDFTAKELFQMKWKEKSTNHVPMLMIELGVNPYKRTWNGLPPLYGMDQPDLYDLAL